MDTPTRLAASDSFAMNFQRSWPSLDEQAAAVAPNLVAANYYVILDASGSMNESGCSGGQAKIQAAKSAIVQFAGQIPASANLGLAVFDANGLSERLGLGQVDRRGFESAVQQVQAEGGTPLLNAMTLGYQSLQQQARLQLGYGEYHLVMVTDGEANSGQDPTPIVDQVLGASPVIIHTIGFCIGPEHSLNQPGRIDYRAADDPAALAQGLTAVLAESPDFTVSDF
jgi:hypothetical protein